MINDCTSVQYFNSLPVLGDAGWVLITFTNSLDPYQDQQNVGPDMGPNCLTH